LVHILRGDRVVPRIPLAASPIAGIGTVNEASKHCSCACVVGVYKFSWVLRREEEDPRAEELGGEERSEGNSSIPQTP